VYYYYNYNYLFYIIANQHTSQSITILGQDAKSKFLSAESFMAISSNAPM
jgi:hypothetical protein